MITKRIVLTIQVQDDEPLTHQELETIRLQVLEESEYAISHVLSDRNEVGYEITVE